MLKAAGVVDAGGAGLLLLLACLREHVSGAKVVLPPTFFHPAAQLVSGNGPRGEGGSIADLHYEVIFLLDGNRRGPTRCSRRRGAGSASRSSSWGARARGNATSTPTTSGAVLEAGVDAGAVRRISVTDLLQQAAAEDFHRAGLRLRASARRPARQGGHGRGGQRTRASSSCSASTGRRAWSIGGQTMNPSVGDLLEVVEAVPAKTVVLLPNNKNIIPAAEELDRLTRKQVHVIPTRSMPQGIAAAVAYAPNLALESVRVPHGQGGASGAQRGDDPGGARRHHAGGHHPEGDWIGLVDGKVRSSGRPGRPGRLPLITRMMRLVLGSKRARRREQRLRRRPSAPP